MIKELLTISAILLMGIGLADIVGVFVAKFFSNKRTKGNILIVPIDKNSEDAEFVLRSIAYRFRWGSWDKDSKVICIYDGEDTEIKTICESVCESYNFMKFKNSFELEGDFKNL